MSRYFHPDGHEITAEEFDAAFDEAQLQAPRGNSIMTDPATIDDVNHATSRLAREISTSYARLDTLARRLDELEPEYNLLHGRIAALETDVERHAERLDALTRLSGSHALSVMRLDTATELAHTRLDAHEQRLAWLELPSGGPESARIDPQEAPESVEAMLRLPEEPGNATEAHSVTFSQWLDMDLTSAARLGNELLGKGWLRMHQWINADPEVAAALRVYRKVQACTSQYGSVWNGETWMSGGALLAWLKEGEA